MACRICHIKALRYTRQHALPEIEQGRYGVPGADRLRRNYVEAPDKQPLQTAITGNTIVNVGGMPKLAWGIVLDKFANGVTVSNNAVTRNANGLELHDGFNNTISETVFPSAFRPTSR
jgi:parallel beta-helix repeat protein